MPGILSRTTSTIPHTRGSRGALRDHGRLIAAHKLELENAAGDVSLRSSAKVVIIVEAEGHHERTA